jgi:predicted nucleic acid-binding protein
MDGAGGAPRSLRGRTLDFLPADGEMTIADLIAIGTQSIGISRFVPSSVTPVIVDANVLIEDLLRTYDNKRSSLLLSATIGSGRLYVTESTLLEVDEHLPRVAQEVGKDEGRLREALNRTYLPRIRAVDVGDLSGEDERVAALESEDPDDVGAAKLALALSPSVLLTLDKDLLRNGLGVFYDPSENRTGWTFAAVALRDRGLLIGVMVGGEGTFVAGAVATEWALENAQKLLRNEKLMTAGLFILAGIAAILIFSPKARDRAQEALEARGQIAGDAATSVALGIGSALSTSEEARVALDANALQRFAPDTDLERVARQLATAHPGVTVRQLSELLPGVVDPETVLRSSGIFVEIAPGKWALGRLGSHLMPGAPVALEHP